CNTIPPPPPSSLSPYTTLFRSLQRLHDAVRVAVTQGLGELTDGAAEAVRGVQPRDGQWRCGRRGGSRDEIGQHGSRIHRDELIRSEEHTSELQSRENLVCRLLL